MYNKKEVLQKVDMLYSMWKKGSLGGEVMPEDANPHLDKPSVENYLYFTLPMALNYQRNSYKLWESALNTYNDKETIRLIRYWLYVIYQYTDRKYKSIVI